MADGLIFFILSFVLGTLIGSYVNVIVYRFHTGKSPNKGRSICFSCGKILRWFELIPLLSFAFLRGRCLSCKSGISIQYPIVEIITGISFFVIGFLFWPIIGVSWLIMIILWAIAAILIVIFVYDFKHKIIPDQFSFIFAGLSLIYGLLTYGFDIWFLLAGPILFIPFYILWLISDGRWIGLGDGKLAVGIGWLLGILDGITAVVLGFWIGAGVSIIFILGTKFLLSGESKKITMKTEIPFAPFLIIGTVLQFFFHFSIFN